MGIATNVDDSSSRAIVNSRGIGIDDITSNGLIVARDVECRVGKLVRTLERSAGG